MKIDFREPKKPGGMHRPVKGSGARTDHTALFPPFFSCPTETPPATVAYTPTMTMCAQSSAGRDTVSSLSLDGERSPRAVWKCVALLAHLTHHCWTEPAVHDFGWRAGLQSVGSTHQHFHTVFSFPLSGLRCCAVGQAKKPIKKPCLPSEPKLIKLENATT